MPSKKQVTQATERAARSYAMERCARDKLTMYVYQQEKTDDELDIFFVRSCTEPAPARAKTIAIFSFDGEDVYEMLTGGKPDGNNA